MGTTASLGPAALSPVLPRSGSGSTGHVVVEALASGKNCADAMSVAKTFVESR